MAGRGALIAACCPLVAGSGLGQEAQRRPGLRLQATGRQDEHSTSTWPTPLCRAGRAWGPQGSEGEVSVGSRPIAGSLTLMARHVWMGGCACSRGHTRRGSGLQAHRMAPNTKPSWKGAVRLGGEGDRAQAVGCHPAGKGLARNHAGFLRV